MAKLKKVGSVAVNPELVTHVTPHRDGCCCHFVGGSNVVFGGADAKAAEELLVEKAKDDDAEEVE